MRYFVESYGCTMNYGEGDELSEKMRLLGHVPADSPEDAEIVVLNTCTVVDTTEKKMISRISDLKKEGKEIIVTGCMAKAQDARIRVRLPDSVMIPPGSYYLFSESVSKRYGSSDVAAPAVQNMTAVLPIAQGCVGNCSYCITKLARGDLVSYPSADIVRRFTEMIENGAKEILLTAQDTACYGWDIDSSLPALLAELLKVNGEYRIRIGMMNPNSLMDITEKLLDSMNDERVYKFIHIPVQSGSNDILKMMNRPYTADEFMILVAFLRSKYPDISISTDIISGFPGETNEDHMKSVELIMELGADTVNVTRFSARPGTVAFSMDGQVHGRTCKERSREITSIKSDTAFGCNEAMIGKVCRVLVTERGRDGTMIARTENYRPVGIKGTFKLGTFLDVEIVSAAPTHLFGRVLNK